MLIKTARILLKITIVLAIVAIILGLYILVSEPAYAAEIECDNSEVPVVWAATIKTNEESALPELAYIPTEDEIYEMAKTVWLEARGCSQNVRLGVIWHILNRVDGVTGDYENFPDTIYGVITQKGQMCYRRSVKPSEAIVDECKAVVNAWLLEKQGFTVTRTIPKDYVFMSDSTGRMRFRTHYHLKDGEWMWVD